MRKHRKSEAEPAGSASRPATTKAAKALFLAISKDIAATPVPPVVETAPHDHPSERLFDDAARSLAALEDFADNAHECANLDSQTSFEVMLALSFRARTLIEKAREQLAWKQRMQFREVSA